MQPAARWGPHAASLALILPLPLPPACLFRFNVLSLVYLLFLLLLPWFPGPGQRSAGGKGVRGPGWAARGQLRSGGAGQRGGWSLPSSPCGFPPAGQRGSAWQPRSVNYSPAPLLINLPLQNSQFGAPALLTKNLRAGLCPPGGQGCATSSPSTLPGHSPRCGHAWVHHPRLGVRAHPPGGYVGRVCPPPHDGCPQRCRLPARRARLSRAVTQVRPRLKALPSEYFMGSPGRCREPSRGFSGKKPSGGRVFGPGLLPSRRAAVVGSLPVPRPGKTGAGPGEPGGMGVWLQLVEGLTGLAVRGTPGTCPQPPPGPPPGCSATDRELPPDAGPGAVGLGSAWCRLGGRGLRGQGGGEWSLAPCIAPCLGFSSDTAERMLLGCAGCTVRHPRSRWDHGPGADPRHLWAQPQRTPAQLYPRVLGPCWGCWRIPGSARAMGDGVPVSRRSHRPPPESSAGDQHHLPPRPFRFPNMPVHTARPGPAAGAQL